MNSHTSSWQFNNAYIAHLWSGAGRAARRARCWASHRPNWVLQASRTPNATYRTTAQTPAGGWCTLHVHIIRWLPNCWTWNQLFKDTQSHTLNKIAEIDFVDGLPRLHEATKLNFIQHVLNLIENLELIEKYSFEYYAYEYSIRKLALSNHVNLQYYTNVHTSSSVG